MNWIFNLVINFFTDLGAYFILVRDTFRKPEKWSINIENLFKELDKLGLSSMGIVAIISLFMGAVITLQTSSQLTNSLIPAYLIGFTTRQSTILEFSPTIISLILAGKLGSNIASELGTMRISEQIDALEIMGVNAKSLLILPKVMAAMIFNPVLIVYSMFLSMLGGYLVTFTLDHITVEQYMEGIYYDFKLSNVWYSLVKTVVFAFIITSIPAFFGYSMRGGSVEVGIASTKGVVYSSIVILIANYLLTEIILM